MFYIQASRLTTIYHDYSEYARYCFLREKFSIFASPSCVSRPRLCRLRIKDRRSGCRPMYSGIAVTQRCIGNEMQTMLS